jgi:hypothetical protein
LTTPCRPKASETRKTTAPTPIIIPVIVKKVLRRLDRRFLTAIEVRIDTLITECNLGV